MNPFDWTGQPFLILFGLLLAVTILAGLAIPHWLRPPGRDAGALDEDETAWLAGGKQRLVDAVVARLLARRALTMVGADKFAAMPGAASRGIGEAFVLDLAEPAPWSSVTRRLAPHARSVKAGLRRKGLLTSAAERAELRFYATLPYALLIGFGSIKLLVGEARERPVGILTMLLIVAFLFALIRWITVGERTRAALGLIRTERQARSRLERAPTNDEIGLAVALFGTGVLAGSAWAGYHVLRSAGGEGSGGGETSSSDGGGGDGGGGCGGCGG